MNIFRHTNKIFLILLFIILAYMLYLLMGNISRGFDITDESFYILNAQHPDHVYPVIRRDGFYNGIFYFLSNGNLMYHRLLGILFLLGSSVWLAIELIKYITEKFNYSMNGIDKLIFIVPVVTGALAYYRYWLITPSYNWLALIGSLFVLIALLRIVTNKENDYNKFFNIDYFILSFAFNFVFMGKPTTALLLAIIVFLFSIFEFKNINIKKAFPSVAILTVFIVIGHIIFLDGGLISYYDRLIESLQRFAMIDSSYTLENRTLATLKLFKEYFFEQYFFHQISNGYIYSFFIVNIVLYILHFKKNILSIYIVFVYFIFIVYSYFLFMHGIKSNFRLLWFRTTELLFLSIILMSISIFMTDQIKIYFTKSIKLLFVVLIFLSISLAISFGTNGNIIHAMSSSLIFVVLSILIINYMLDKLLCSKIFVPTSGIILSLYVLFTLLHAYEHPYRLVTSIKGQNQKVELLGGLYVDKSNKQYIDTLQKISAKYIPQNRKISLLDMTGGTPGANVILNADFFGHPWFAGAYKGSNMFLERALNTYKGTDKLKEAWILTAPEGRRKLDLNILNKIGLDFPKSYIKIGTVQTAHRNELQELWKPISTLK